MDTKKIYMNEPVKRKFIKRFNPEFNRPLEVENILAEVINISEFKNSAEYRYLYNPLDNENLEILFARRFVTFLPDLYSSLKDDLTNHYFLRLLKYIVLKLAHHYNTKFIGISIGFGPNLNFDNNPNNHPNIIEKLHFLTQCIFLENEELKELPIADYNNATEPMQYDKMEGNFIYNFYHWEISKDLDRFKFLNISLTQLNYIYALTTEFFEEIFKDLIIPSFFNIKRGFQEAILFLNANQEEIQDIRLISPKLEQVYRSSEYYYNLRFDFLKIKVKTNKNIHQFHLSFTNMENNNPPYPYKLKDKLEFFWWGLLNKKIVDTF